MGADQIRVGQAGRRRNLCARWRRALGDRSIVGAASVLPDSLERRRPALAQARRAVALAPVSYIAHGNLAPLPQLGSVRRGRRRARGGTSTGPGAALLRAVRGALRLEQGRQHQSLAACRQEGTEPLQLAGVAMVRARPGGVRSDAALQELSGLVLGKCRQCQ